MQQKRKYLAAILSVVFAVSLLMNTFAVGVFAQDDREVLVEQIVSELQQDNSEADQSQKGETPAMRPEETAIPEVTASEEPVMTPAPAASPAATETPEFTATPEPSATPEPTVTPEPSATPEPTVTPEPSATPEPTVTPEPSATPEPTEVPLPTVEEQKAQIRDLLEKSTSAGQMSEDELERALEEIDALASMPLAIAENGQEDDELSDLMDQLENARVAMEDMRAAWEAKREGRLDQLPQTGRENSWRYQNGETVEYDTMDAAMDLPDGVSAFSVGGGYWGIDVSHHQGVIDWEAVKAAGIDFAIIRCGYGMNLPEQDDKQWSRNVSECERLGIPYGVYFYSYAMTADMAVEEAIHAVRLLEGHNPDLPVFYDMEENRQLVVGNSGLAEMARIFCDIVSSKGYEVGVYANLNWWNHYLTDAVFENWYRWVAEWRSSCSYNGRYEMWQYTDEGQISGINGFVDMNYWYGDLPGDERVPITEGTYTIASALDENKVLDVVWGSYENGANIDLYSKNGTGAQQFKIIPVGDNYYKIQNSASGKVLDVKFGAAVSGTNVQQWEYNGSAAQLWSFEDAGNGYYYIRSKCNGLYLDINGASSADGTNVQVYLKNQSSAQKFRLQPANANVQIQEGVYVISSMLDTSKVLDIVGGSAADTANLQLYQSNGSYAQRFAITAQGDGSYKITNMGSGKALDVVYGSSTPGTNVWQYSSNDSAAQQWYFEKGENGAYFLRSKCNGLYLDVNCASTANGTNIQVYTGNRSAAQQFYLQKVGDLVPEGVYTIVSALDSNKVVDINCASAENGANVQLYTANGTTAQKFRFVSAGGGQYYIVNAGTGKALDVTYGSTVPGTNVQQWEKNDTSAQRWYLENAENGKWFIRSVGTGLYLDVNWASTADGTNIQGYTGNGSTAQQFLLVAG
ncbi:RICIN domain-containing protein [Allofournierella massiliensis]|uniref:GH25 family lysozyme M1 (1,4-beta-N-acetylmuramidase) n=1 Tax=Allofournierella massiliensis TaxID=1650663 RepID=A0A4R1R1E5_9FIRM|nr:RICIN domain-containing protein [Fournierella massiliensis]TCL59153.1 GH25 family lysozyme M1 (1,4-beta-N-acetylmuramidase) [Fournierella massiliensis]